MIILWFWTMVGSANALFIDFSTFQSRLVVYFHQFRTEYIFHFATFSNSKVYFLEEEVAQYNFAFFHFSTSPWFHDFYEMIFELNTTRTSCESDREVLKLKNRKLCAIFKKCILSKSWNMFQCFYLGKLKQSLQCE